MVDTAITDSYIVTRELALAYFAGDPRAAAFIATPATMDWYLRRATKIIDNLPLKGTTYYYFVFSDPIAGQQQDRQFPRYIDDMCYGWNTNTILPEVPQEVLDACCEEALALYLAQINTDESERDSLKKAGVTSFSLGGGYSESFGASDSDKHKGLLSPDAWRMLGGYIAGAIEATM